MPIRAEMISEYQNIDNLLDDEGIIKAVHATTFDAFDRNSLRVWCHLNARYGLPTVELIDWLKTLIHGRKTIEIGSGHGDFARHLGIHGTDNKMQNWPDVAAFYQATGQPTIKYRDWIEEIDALEAVQKYQPEVVIGSWITHWIDPNLPFPSGGGNMYGVKEDQVLATGVTYIMIGNLVTHGSKPILKLKHREYDLPFLRSRAIDQSLNRVFVWNG